jgi:hypothetical protein
MVNGFDCDGVITVGLYPGPDDIIITGRSYEEQRETLEMLKKKGITNPVYFNPVKFKEKTRESSGQHKVNVLRTQPEITVFFEDDPIQKAVIEEALPDVTVVHIVHELTEKENVRHIDG